MVVEKKSLIDKFIEQYQADATKKQYRGAINRFFKVLNKEPTHYFNKKKKLKDYEEDMTTYIFYLINIKKYASKTRIHDTTAVNQFFIDNDVEISQKFWKRLNRRIAPASRIMQEIIPPKQEMQKILSYADIKMRAFILMMSSSGCRTKELTSLKEKDIDFENARFYIEYTTDNPIAKNKRPRWGFLSSEALEAAKIWRDTKNTWRKAHKKQKTINAKGVAIANPFYSDKYKDTFFNCCDETIENAWGRLLKRAGLDEKCPKTDRYKRRLYTLRKYFAINLGYENKDLAEHLMGHGGNGLVRIYRDLNPDQLQELYKKVEQKLFVFKEVVEDKKVRDAVVTQAVILNDQQDKVKELTDTVNRLQNELNSVDKFISIFMDAGTGTIESRIRAFMKTEPKIVLSAETKQAEDVVIAATTTATNDIIAPMQKQKLEASINKPWITHKQS